MFLLFGVSHTPSYACLRALILLSPSVKDRDLLFVRIPRCLSSNAGVRLMCPFAFEFISCYCTVICAPAGEGVTDEALPTEVASPLGRAKGHQSVGLLFCFSPPTFVRPSRGPFTLHISRRNLCACKTEPLRADPIQGSGCKGCVCIYV